VLTLCALARHCTLQEGAAPVLGAYPAAVGNGAEAQDSADAAVEDEPEEAAAQPAPQGYTHAATQTQLPAADFNLATLQAAQVLLQRAVIFLVGGGLLYVADELGVADEVLATLLHCFKVMTCVHACVEIVALYTATSSSADCYECSICGVLHCSAVSSACTVCLRHTICPFA
jgi:hypothetical protein